MSIKGIAQVGINIEKVDKSAIFQVYSSDKGVLIPRLTAQERLDIVSPAVGLLVFDVDSFAVFNYTGSVDKWKPVGKGVDEDWYLKHDTLFAGGKRVFMLTNERVGINTTGEIEKTAIFEVSDTRRGVLFPSLRYDQKINLTDADTGALIYQIDEVAGFKPGFYYFDGSVWVGLAKRIIWKRIFDTMYSLDSAVIFRYNTVSLNSMQADTSAVFFIGDTDKGALLPRFKKANRNAIVNPANGLIYFQTDDTIGFYFYRSDLNTWQSWNQPEGTWVVDNDSLYYWQDYSFTIKNGQVGINQRYPESSSILDVSSLNSGILLPRLSSSEKNAINNPSQGLWLYDTNDMTFSYYDGTEWVDMNPAVVNRVRFTSEYKQSVIAPDGSDNVGLISTSNTGSGMNYYEWKSPMSNINDCDIYITIILPEKYVALHNDSAFVLNYRTNTVDETDGYVSIYIYKEGSTQPIARKDKQNSTSWNKVVISRNDFSSLPNSSEKLVVGIKLGSTKNKYVQIGDLNFNYLSNQ